MDIIFPALGRLLSGFMILYVYCVTRKKSKIRSESKNQLIYENPISNKKDKYYYLKLLFITCLELTARSLNFIYFSIINANEDEVYSKNTKDVLTLLDILMRYILSMLMLKVKTYKHHIWAIYAIIFGFVLIIPFDVLDIYYSESVNGYHTISYIFVLFLQTIIYPYEDTLIKKFFNTYYIFPENMLFSCSVFENLILFVISLILYFTKVITFDLHFTLEKIFTISILIITITIREYIIMKINYIYSSQSISFLIISQSISISLIDIINFCKEKDKSEIGYHIYVSFPFEIIALIIIFIATSVYDEIIIINIFGLNLNVKKGIIKRAQIEVDSISSAISRQLSFEQADTLDEIDDNNAIN